MQNVTLDNSTVERQILDIFIIYPDQIKIAQRFVSGFMIQTDATFNTNKVKFLLSNLVGVDNIGYTFAFAYVFQTSESSDSFEFIDEYCDIYI